MKAFSILICLKKQAPFSVMVNQLVGLLAYFALTLRLNMAFYHNSFQSFMNKQTFYFLAVSKAILTCLYIIQNKLAKQR